MSQTAPFAAIIAFYDSALVGSYCDFAVLALLAYEYFATLPNEVSMFWTGKFTGASALFYFNRYPVLIVNALIVFGYIPMTNSTCALLVKGKIGMQFCQYIPWAVFSSLRAFALSRQNWPLAIIVFLLAMVPCGVNFTQYRYGLTGVVDPIYGCSPVIPIAPALAKIYTIVSRVSLMAADIIVIATTWFSMHRRGALEGEQLASSFAGILLRDGMMYFIALFFLNSLHLLFELLSVVSSLEPISDVTLFTNPFTAVLMSRFLLDLQAANRKALDLDSQDGMSRADGSAAAHEDSLVFERVVGSIGSSIIPGDGDSDQWQLADAEETARTPSQEMISD